MTRTNFSVQSYPSSPLLIAAYEVLQRNVSNYFHVATNQKTAEEIGGVLTVSKVLSQFLGDPAATPGSEFEELLGLSLDPQDLQGEIASFVDEVRFAVGLWGLTYEDI